MMTTRITLGALALLVTSLAACAEDAAPPEPTPRADLARRSQAATCRPTEVSEETFAVMQALAPHCAGCHQDGVRGYFSGPTAFQSLLVGDPNMISPGDPGGSELVRLLEGQGTGAFTQMPIGVKSYAQLAQEGEASMSMERIRAWVSALEPQVRDASPDRSAVRVRRMTAPQMKRAMYQQLGLTHDDFFRPASNYGIEKANARNDLDYPLASTDELPQPWRQTTIERYQGLGGGSSIAQVPHDPGFSPTASLTITQVSQAWCRKALLKPDNTTLFPTGGALGASDGDVRDTISRWSLQFLGERWSDARVEALVESVWAPLYAESNDPEHAYVGLCSYFIRHPRWLLY